jgi:predicted membrane chloride channel (bestrophin family)
MTAHVRLTAAVPKGAPVEAVPAGYITGSASLFAVPWSLIGVIILVFLAAFGGWRLRWWQRRRMRGKLAAVADSARRETERRLLDSKDAAGRPQKRT